MSDTIGELVVKVTADTKAMTRAIEGDAEKAGKSFAQKMGTGMKGLAVAGLAAGAAAAAGLAVVGKQAIDTASDLNETATKVDQLFGPAGSAQIKEWSQTTSETMGQSALAAQNAAADFAIFGKVAGLAGQDLVDFSKDNTKLASDLSSFFNTEPAEAAQAIASALRGESEPMRKYGVIINDAALKQAYFKETGEKVTGTLTGQQKALAANRLIWDQTKDAQDDFAKTSDGLANSQRTLAATLEDVKGVVGQGLLPAVTTIVQAIGPLAKELQEPLAQIASVIGEQLASAFETIAPLLKPFAEALTSLGGSVLSALIGAVKALIPALIPLLDIFAKVGQRLGPLLEKVLGKVAEVLTKVLSAVVPVIGALLDLIFEILEPLWPLVEIVVDVFMMLVDALKPLLDAVMALIRPLGTLIKAGLKAIMPVLKPLMPIIELLANLIGQVLVRAIGLVMAGLGKWIETVGKVATFLIDKFADPVLKVMMAFFKNLIDGAANAFGWVPGIGPKLREAADNFDTWSKDTSKAVKDAAENIAGDAEAIGKSMVDEGLEMAKSGQSKQSMYDAGYGLGTNIGDGMQAGIASKGAGVAYESQKMSIQAIKAAKTTLESNSPSKVFIKIGGDVVEGFKIGLGKMDGVSDKMVKGLEQGISAAEKRINDWVRTQKAALDDAVQAWKDYEQQAVESMLGGIDLSGAFNTADASEQAAQDAYDALQAARERASGADATDSDRVEVAAAEQAYNAAKAAIVTWDQVFADQIDTSKTYAAAMQAVQSAITEQFGTDSPGGQMLMQQLMVLGPVAGSRLADQLIGSNGKPTSMLGTMVGMLTEANVFASKAGVSMANDAKGQGVEMAAATLQGMDKKIKAEKKRIRRLGQEIGNGVVIGFRSKESDFRYAVQSYIDTAFATMGVRSPSRVFMTLGDYAAQGYNIGFDREISSIPPIPSTGKGVGISDLVTGGGDTSVKVFIGDRELTDIVDVQVEKNSLMGRDFAVAGRRDY